MNQMRSLGRGVMIIYTVFALGLVCILVWTIDIPYSCNGVNMSESSCTATTVECTLEGTVSGSTKCTTTSRTNEVTCEVTQGTTVIASTTSTCTGCGGSGGTGGTGGGGDPQYCSLFWYPYDPWAM